MKTNRTGKIARLPRKIRDEINQLLDDNHPGVKIVDWLNGLPAVHKVLDEHFNGVPISEQNLSEWKAGGFLDWLAHQENLAQAQELAANAAELQTATAGHLADHLATALTARYASLLATWNGEVTAQFTQQVGILRSLARDITGLRRGDHQVTRLQIERDRVDQQRKYTDAERVKQFDEWSQNTKVRDCICRNWQSPEEREKIMTEILFPHGKIPKY